MDSAFQRQFLSSSVTCTVYPTTCTCISFQCIDVTQHHRTMTVESHCHIHHDEADHHDRFAVDFYREISQATLTRSSPRAPQSRRKAKATVELELERSPIRVSGHWPRFMPTIRCVTRKKEGSNSMRERREKNQTETAKRSVNKGQPSRYRSLTLRKCRDLGDEVLSLSLLMRQAIWG